MSDWNVTALDADLDVIRVLLQYRKLVLTERLWRPDSFELDVADATADAPPNLADATYLAVQGVPLLPWVEERDTQLRQVTYRGSCVGAMLDHRIVVPPASESHQVETGPATTRMRAFVHAQAAQDADPDRQVPHLTAPSPTGEGPSATTRGRYDVVSDLLKKIGTEASIGWHVRLEAGEIIWEPIVGTQRDVILDVDLETAQRMRLLRDQRDRVSTVYVGGQGEGASRTVVVRGDGQEGLDRRETWIDARDTDDTETLETRGDEEIAASSEPDVLEVTAAETGAWRYGTDYLLGDIVTVRATAWGITVPARIVEVERTLTSQGIRTKVALGRPWPTSVDRDAHSEPAFART